MIENKGLIKAILPILTSMINSNNTIKKGSPDLPASGSLLELEFQNSDNHFNEPRPGSQVLSRFEKAKFRSQSLAGYFQAVLNGEIPASQDILCDLSDRRRKLHQCGSLLTIRNFYETGRIEHFASRCRQHMLCSSCAIIRGSKIMANILQRVQARGLNQCWPYLLTVTIKDGFSLANSFSHLSGCWSRLVNRRKGRNGFGGNSLGLLVGGVATFEVKRGRNSKIWHPHIHALVFSREPLPVVQRSEQWLWPDLSAEWFDITGDSKIIECHPIHDDKGCVLTPNQCFVSVSDGNSIINNDFIRAVCECSKYALKVTEMSNSDILHIWQTLRGSRFIRTFGEMYGKIESDEEPTSEEIENFIDTVYQWKKTGYTAIRYKLNLNHKSLPASSE